jgi:hypothetical protein
MLDHLFPIEREILHRLNDVAGQLYAEQAGTPEWTLRFKKGLKELGEERGFEVWAKFDDDSASGWLWDLCWADCPDEKRNRPDGNWRGLRAIELACEIEWKQHDDWTLEDFLKLTVCNAVYRLFIFTAAKRRLEEQFDLLMNACPGSRGFRYLAVGVPDDRTEALHYRAWTL